MTIDRKALCDLPSKSARIPLAGHIAALLRRPDVLRVTGLTQSALYRLLRADEFPKPVAIIESTTAWRQSEIIGWIDQRPRAGAA